MTEATEAGPEFTAAFPTVAYATEFEGFLGRPGCWATNVARKGRTVTWDAVMPADSHTTRWELFEGYLENVGYYGSTERRKATLNGVPAPMAY